MSWDIVIFSTDQKLASVEEVDEHFFRPTNFDQLLQRHFPVVSHPDGHREIYGIDFTIDYDGDDEPGSVTTFHLYGENALYALIYVAKLENWQLFDTGIGAMIDLDHPEKNGYGVLQAYLKHVLKQSR